MQSIALEGQLLYLQPGQPESAYGDLVASVPSAVYTLSAPDLYTLPKLFCRSLLLCLNLWSQPLSIYLHSFQEFFLSASAQYLLQSSQWPE